MKSLLAGALCLACSLLLSAALTAESLGSLSLPGCGPKSACARLAATPWGHLPILEWPLAFLGLAYFTGLLLAWSRCAAGIPALLLNVVRLGAAASVGLLGIMLAEGLLCAYCAGAHATHLAFCFVAHRHPRREAAQRAPVALLLLAFGAVSAGLFQARESAERRALQEQERELAASLEELGAAAPSSPSSPSPLSEVASTPTASPADGVYPSRYVRGPEKAAVRIVLFTDFECEDCKRVHADLDELMASREDVSVAALHFPMCTDCNGAFTERNLHPNACWAARAAEAAGMLRGAEGFWRTARWLFENDGKFQKAELEAFLLEEGYDPDTFRRTMEGPETLARVRADIEEGLRRGLHFTPMVFLNGQELQGVLAPRALPRAVEKLLEAHPAPATAAADVPQTALEKHVADWRIQPRRDTGPERRRWRANPPDASIRIVVWGDYQERHTATADRILRGWANSHADTSYVFRHFPAHSGCNTKMQRVMHPNACILALAAEAASVVGDEMQYWLLHEWLFEHAQDVTPESLLRQVSQLGMDAEVFEATMKSAEVAAAVDAEAQRGFPMLFHSSIPAIYINGKVVPRWRLEGANVLETILESLQ